MKVVVLSLRRLLAYFIFTLGGLSGSRKPQH